MKRKFLKIYTSLDVVTASPKLRRELYLDFLRGVAILLAMGWHFNSVDSGIWLVDLLLMPGRTIGWAGVDIFFVLSGFLIGGLILKEYQITGGVHFGRFLIRRAFKIWPIFYAYLFLLLISGRYQWDAFFLQNFFHVQNYFLTPLAHLWSLAVEEQFYILFAIGFWIFIKLKININQFVVVLVGVIVFCLLLRIIAYTNSVDLHLIQIQTQYRIDALSCGICLAYFNLYQRDKFDRFSSKKGYLAIALIIVVTALIFTQGHEALKVTVGYTLSYFVGALSLLYFHKLKFINKGNFIVKAVAWIGVYSYAMYVFQFVMMRVIEAIFRKLNITHIPPILDLFIKYAGAIALAVLLTKLIEKPMLILRDKLFPTYSSR